jgi:hypothetical protein
MYGQGFGTVDGGDQPKYSGSKLKSFFMRKDQWDQKKEFLKNIQRTLNYFNKKPYKLYYLIENPELGFSPKNCQIRPFHLFQKECKLPYKAYIERSKEYRNFVYDIINDYTNIMPLDPKKFFCDNSFCYALKNGKMLYADDDHLSVDGAILQANYFKNKLINRDN